LHFIVEPEGAIVDIAGSALGSGSPIETELDPGVYSFTVKHAGFQTFTSSVTVSAGDRQTINVSLVPEQVAVADPTPPPAPPTLPADPSVTGSIGKGSDASTPEEDAAPATPPPDNGPKNPKTNGTSKKNPRNRPSSSGTSNQAASGGGSDDERDELPTKPDPVVTKPDPVVTKPDPVVTTPDPVVKQNTKVEPPVDSKPARTPVVGPNVVQKVSGEIPTLRSSSGSGDVTAKICIDEAGKVTSVKMMKGPADVSSDLQRAMFSWRFKPYANRDGKLSPVCFPHSVRLVLKP
jgi:hypothetical protein